MGYCFICGDQCDGSSVKTVPGIKIETATKAGWLPSRIPRRLAGPNPRNWWQDTVLQSISSNWNLCGPCAAEFESSSSRKESAPPPEVAPPPRSASIPAAPAAKEPSTPSSGGASIATALDTSHRPPAMSAPDGPDMKTLRRNQLLILSPGSLGIMIAIVMFATAEDGVPFSFLLVPISLIAVAALGFLVLEGRKVQIAKAALERSVWGEFLQSTFQAWRGGLLDELAAWYRSAPSNYHGFEDFATQNIEVRSFRKVGLWFVPEPEEFLVEVDGHGKGKPGYVLTNRRGIVAPVDGGYYAFPWTAIRKISTNRSGAHTELVLTGAEGAQTLVLAHAPADKTLDFLVKKQGISLSGAVRVQVQDDPARSVESIVNNATSASLVDLEWLGSQGAEAYAAIQAVSDKVRSGDWSLGESLGKLCQPLGAIGTEEARKLLTTLLQLPDPTREAELVREGAARGLDRLRSISH